MIKSNAIQKLYYEVTILRIPGLYQRNIIAMFI